MTHKEKKQVKEYQKLINSGRAWRFEGAIGRTAMELIQRGYCCLGVKSHTDYYGNHVPSRFEVQKGTKGSLSYMREKQKTFI
jgi:hypothetical protein